MKKVSALLSLVALLCGACATRTTVPYATGPTISVSNSVEDITTPSTSSKSGSYIANTEVPKSVYPTPE